jgi:hypothetical protein
VPKPTKYVKGDAFASMDDLNEWLEAGGWVYLTHGMHLKPYHPAWVVSLRFRTVQLWLKSGGVYRAIERAALEEEAWQVPA